MYTLPQKIKRIFAWSEDTKTAMLWATVYQIVVTVLVIIFFLYQYKTFDFTLLQERFIEWDSRPYLFLSEHGYVTHGIEAVSIAYFPLFPFFIRLNPLFWISPFVSAITVAILFSWLGHVFFIKWLQARGLPRHRVMRVFLLLCFSPITVFFIRIYTEPLFLFLTAFFLFSLEKKSYRAAVAAGLLASAARNVGLTFILPYLGYLYQDVGFSKKEWKKYCWALLMPIGFGIYSFINYHLFGNPLWWTVAQKVNWNKEVVNPLVQYSSVLLGIPNLLFSSERLTIKLDYVTTLLLPFFLSVVLFMHKQKHTVVLVLWAFIQCMVVISQSFWLSNTRYIAMIIPLYLFIEEMTAKNKSMYLLTLCLFAVSAFIGISLFVKGDWVY
jgi:hypothetical protein